MNGIPTRQQVENLRERYPVGARVVLHHMDDPYAPIPPGTKGTVTYVDDMGEIGVNWDTGSTSPGSAPICSPIWLSCPPSDRNWIW